MSQLGFIIAAFWCRNCEDWHRRPVACAHGRLPDAVIFASDINPGLGDQYSLTTEDLGQTDGMSFPVYRPVATIRLHPLMQQRPPAGETC